uniref:helix-turn-helix domain-containing protein n=1 Tax=Anaerococcus mediterraneensis TaxID=1870984 RepID=UPI000931981A|nr:helix-turn-helix transcriptional regulator [Anaerococcus mediterraneensis]
MGVGEKIYKLRKEKGISQERLGQSLGVSRQAVSKWETGTLPDIENLSKLADFFSCSVDFLLDKEKDIENQIPVEKKTKEKSYINIFIYGPILILFILFFLSKIISYPISQKDFGTGLFYVGFRGFIAYYDLESLYIGSLLVLLGGFSYKSFLGFRKIKNEEKKVKIYYLARTILILAGLIGFLILSLRPYGIIFDLKTYIIFAIYIFFILGLGFLSRK